MTKEKLNTVDIKGKKYVTVNSRIKYFNEAYTNGRITTEIVEHRDGIILMKTTVIPDITVPDRFFTGLAYEKESSSFINKTSYIENCETSAIGRALGFMGIGVDTSIASAEEVRNAIHQQDNPAKPPLKAPQALSEPQEAPKQTKSTKEPPKEKEELKNDSTAKPLSTTQRFVNARKALGDEDYFHILKKFHVKSATEFKMKHEAEEALNALERNIELKEFTEEGKV